MRLGERGFCDSRINLQAEVYSLSYGDISAVGSRPIEIKPFFHYYPGSTALTFSTWSCNFRCSWCQNYTLSRVKPEPARARYISPEEMVKLAVRAGDKGVCVSFAEPTLLFEYARDVFNLARERNLYCCYVSNGYLTLAALKALVETGLDAINIDVKGDERTYRNYCGDVDVSVVWRNAHWAKQVGLHVEIVHLVVTGLNDNERSLTSLIERHLKEVGADTPLHFTRYFPAYKYLEPSTEVEILETACKMAKEAGIRFPYIGNVPGHRLENTFCPRCGELLIKRFSSQIRQFNLTPDKTCPKCGERIPIIG
jgi:pyruvate formate lyase activating enzyme